MKVGLIVLIAAAVLGALIGTLIYRDPGYVLVSYGDYALETSVWFSAVLLLVLYFALRFVVFAFTRLFRGKGNIRTWNRERIARRARTRTVKGLLLMGEGRWEEARKAFLMNASRVETPLINYLHAAGAADEMGDVEERDRLLRLAHETTPGSRFAVGVTQARLQMQRGQLEQCLATLLQLREESPRHQLVLSMLASCYQQLGDWRALRDLIGDLHKAKAATAEDLASLQKEAWTGLLGSYRDGGVGGDEDLAHLWKSCPRELRGDPVLVALYVDVLEQDGRAGDAESVLRDALNNSWSEELVVRYGTLGTEDVARQLTTAEGWLKERPNDAQLLLALGRVSLRAGEWSRAREYFEASLKLKATQSAYAELGRLCNALGEHSRGAEYLAMSLSGLPDLPLPGSVQV
ncbi:MAG: heme biosynthesis HemY N-terminal domain-containing protein [Pseudomonadales bacterium]|mgnify:FL=1|nr:heme biosynthesis HemY N-terminal domain-containing protein [Pseudomonadales bacterium]MDP6469870.1 heme biosynthesis HemY N-terminal domain-containing protein [Pseudomonadales bacterium]MDP6827527.1 heme biosynthesis HemY N-terminal domain-containing protein [Pseudomonadales bacterium]MDP6971340.1 heme biosynthesis HemY N-terminal domain-containing protein [Pseudomonadales bacterium]